MKSRPELGGMLPLDLLGQKRIVHDGQVCSIPGWLPSGYGREGCNGRFHGGTIYNDAASGLIWVENQVSLGASETIMGKEHFEQWLYDIACIEVKHFDGNNGIFSLEEYRLECSKNDCNCLSI